MWTPSLLNDTEGASYSVNGSNLNATNVSSLSSYIDHKPSGNISSSSLLLLEQPSRRLEVFGPSGQATVIVLYSLVSFLAFTTNSLVILVELYGKRSAPNLKKFLINLAISDLLLGVLAVPFAYTHMLLVRLRF